MSRLWNPATGARDGDPAETAKFERERLPCNGCSWLSKWWGVWWCDKHDRVAKKKCDEFKENAK